MKDNRRVKPLSPILRYAVLLGIISIYNVIVHESHQAQIKLSSSLPSRMFESINIFILKLKQCLM